LFADEAPGSQHEAAKTTWQVVATNINPSNKANFLTIISPFYIKQIKIVGLAPSGFVQVGIVIRRRLLLRVTL
jgi:hypothetical protein